MKSIYTVCNKKFFKLAFLPQLALQDVKEVAPPFSHTVLLELTSNSKLYKQKWKKAKHHLEVL